MFALRKEWNWRVNQTLLCLGTDEDLEFYVRKCGDILGVTSKLPKDQQDAKHILEHIFFQVVEFKKLNQEAHWHGSPSGDVTHIDCLQYSLVLQVLTKCLQMNNTWWSLREWNFYSNWRVPANNSRVYKQALSRLEDGKWCGIEKNRARPEGSSAPAFIKMSRAGPVHMDARVWGTVCTRTFNCTCVVHGCENFILGLKSTIKSTDSYLSQLMVIWNVKLMFKIPKRFLFQTLNWNKIK